MSETPDLNNAAGAADQDSLRPVTASDIAGARRGQQPRPSTTGQPQSRSAGQGSRAYQQYQSDYQGTGDYQQASPYQQYQGTGNYQESYGQEPPAMDLPEVDATPRPQRTPYVRQPRPHKTVEPIDDLAADESPAERYSHDSGYATGGNPLSGHGYRKSRSEMPQLRRDLKYGQYLEIPKGRRDIFASREKKARTRSVVALIAVVIVLVIVVLFVWQYMLSNWGAVS